MQNSNVTLSDLLALIIWFAFALIMGQCIIDALGSITNSGNRCGYNIEPWVQTLVTSATEETDKTTCNNLLSLKDAYK